MLSEDAPKVYEEYVKEEQGRMLNNVQKNCVHSAIRNHFPARIRQQARIFADELRIELSALFGRKVKPCEVHKAIGDTVGYPFYNLEDEKLDNPESETKE